MSQYQKILASDGSLDSKITQLIAFTEGSFKRCDIEELKSLVKALVVPEVPIAVARSVLASIARQIDHLKAEEARDLGESMLESIHSRITSFEEADGLVRDGLHEIYYDVDKDFEKAARNKAGKSMSTLRTESDKFIHFVDIASLFLREDRTIEAESFINRALPVKHECKDQVWQLRFKTAYAQILDSNRKFLEASMRYYEICQITDIIIEDEEISKALGKALVCAVLGPAGPQRSRILGSLYKDVRVKRLEYFNVLEKMYMGRLLRKSEIAVFEGTLLPHQKALLADGSSVLERAVMEHNMLAASNVYQNIHIDELGNLLEILPSKAEQIASKMIIEKRLVGTIDQSNGFIEFSEDADALLNWDKSIQTVCSSLNIVCEKVSKIIN